MCRSNDYSDKRPLCVGPPVPSTPQTAPIEITQHLQALFNFSVNDPSAFTPEHMLQIQMVVNQLNFVNQQQPPSSTPQPQSSPPQ